MFDGICRQRFKCSVSTSDRKISATMVNARTSTQVRNSNLQFQESRLPRLLNGMNLECRCTRKYQEQKDIRRNKVNTHHTANGNSCLKFECFVKSLLLRFTQVIGRHLDDKSHSRVCVVLLVVAIYTNIFSATATGDGQNT